MTTNFLFSVFALIALQLTGTARGASSRQYHVIYNTASKGFTWSEAKEKCGTNGLAVIYNADDMKNALDARNWGSQKTVLWTALNDIGVENKWVQGLENEFTGPCNYQGFDCRNLEIWNDGEPNAENGSGEDCALIREGITDPSNALNDYPCTKTNYGSSPIQALCNGPPPSSKYVILSGSVTWDGAKESCSNYGTGLAQIYTANDVQNALYVRGDKQVRLWTALNDIGKEGKWRQDGKDTNCKAEAQRTCKNLDIWAENEPNNSGSGEDCALIRHETNDPYDALNDGQCTKSKSWDDTPIWALCNRYNSDSAGVFPMDYHHRSVLVINMSWKELTVKALALFTAINLIILCFVCIQSAKKQTKYNVVSK